MRKEARFLNASNFIQDVKSRMKLLRNFKQSSEDWTSVVILWVGESGRSTWRKLLACICYRPKRCVGEVTFAGESNLTLDKAMQIAENLISSTIKSKLMSQGESVHRLASTHSKSNQEKCYRCGSHKQEPNECLGSN